MTPTERACLYGLVAEINMGMSEQHYTFEFNKKSKTLETVKKTASTCRTRHCLTTSELYLWYHTELKKYDDGLSYFKDAFKEYAEHYGLDLENYILLIKNTISDIIKNNPEYLI